MAHKLDNEGYILDKDGIRQRLFGYEMKEVVVSVREGVPDFENVINVVENVDVPHRVVTIFVERE